MFPFGGILTAPGYELKLSAITIIDFGVWPGFVEAGFRLKSDGDINKLEHGSILGAPADEWVQDEFIGIVDGSLYECGVFNLLGDTGQLQGPAQETWHDLSVTREWKLYSTLKNANYAVTGDYKVRQIGYPASEASASLSLDIDLAF